MTSRSNLEFTHIAHPAPVSADQRAVLMTDPGFGRVFTDHMVTIRYTNDLGWHDAKVEPRGPLMLDPASSVFHYAQEIFEGLKAYRTPEGAITLFRPEANADRFADSARRLAMPALPNDIFLDALDELVTIDQAWTPEGEGSLYLRPFMISTEAALGVRPSNSYLFVVLASPVGAYFKAGAKPITVWLSPNFTRAAPGGTGAAKFGGNYAAGLQAQAEASAQGCDQVIFLDAAEHRWVEELGGMNVMFVFEDGSIQTPPLGGTILPGITRASIIELARAQGIEVREEPYSVEQLKADATSGRLREVFACGTAAVLSAIGKVKGVDGEWVVGQGEEGPTTTSLRAALTNIQRGTAPDPKNWVKTVVAGT